MGVRRDGVGPGPGRVLVQAGIYCLVVAGCTVDPSPALLSLVDPAHLTMQDSELLDDSAKTAIRSYLGRMADSAWGDVRDPDLDQLLGECRVLTALLDRHVLPSSGRTATVMVEVPDSGFAEFRLTRLRGRPDEQPTYTGQARRGAMSILLIGDSSVAGRITTRHGDFELESGPFDLIAITPADTTPALRALHLMGASLAGRSSRAARTPAIPQRAQHPPC